MDLIEAANDPDQLALDPYVVEVHRRIGWVRRLQADSILLLEEAFEGDRVFIDLCDNNVPIARRGLGADQDEVAVRDLRTYASPLGARSSGMAIVSEASW